MPDRTNPDILNESESKDDWSYATKELLDTLPRAWTRGLLYLLIVFAGIVLPWATLSKVDETGTARGRLEPKEKTIRLDAPVAGTVAAIKVKEGERVKAGQSLLELESELVRDRLQEQQSKFLGQQNRQNQLELLKNQLTIAIRTQEQQNQAQLLEKQAQVEEARKQVDSLNTLYNFQKQEQYALVEQALQAVNSSQIARNLAEIQLKGAREKYQRYKKAFEDGIISQDRFQETEQLVKENQERLLQAQSNISQAKSHLREKESSDRKIIQQAITEQKLAQIRLQQQQNSYQSLVNSGKLALLKSQEQLNNLEAEITTLNSEIAQSKSQIKSLKFQLQQRVITAPFDGTIFELPIQGAGGVLQPGNKIAEIAPLGRALVLRSQIATAESGSLKKGMPVKIKFDAYPFQNYGVVEGKLIEISPTSKVTETERGQVTAYDLEIELDRTCLPTPSECVVLRPGDTAIAEVVIHQRRIIDLILDPFKKLQKDGLKL